MRLKRQYSQLYRSQEVTGGYIKCGAVVDVIGIAISADLCVITAIGAAAVKLRVFFIFSFHFGRN
jgi:hypothetical protein